eukprot:5554699-Pyramimonas_sp.AAC.1
MEGSVVGGWRGLLSGDGGVCCWGMEKNHTPRTGAVYRARGHSYAGGAGRTCLRASLRGWLGYYPPP